MRKNPSEQTIKKLFALSGNICAFPNCDEEIVDKDGNVIGEICHIEAAEENGPRYNPNQTDDERKAVENLVLLCGKHNKIIDNDANQYTVDYLKQIKKVHESRSLRNEIEITNDMLKKLYDKLDQKQIEYNAKNINIHNGTGDIIRGDKIGNDKVVGDKIINIYPIPPKIKINHLTIIPNYDTKKLIGRKDMLKKLHKMLTENKSAILMNGIGGIGKTTVALAYCNTEKYQKEYQNIVWVTLTQSLKESIINTFIDKNIDFKYNEKEDTDKNFNHLLNTLRNINENNLLVLDNANNDKEIIENKQSLEDTNWKILLTTRCLFDDEYTIKVDKLSEEDAVKVFLQYCKIEDIVTLKKLLFHIDYHTLLTELLAKTLKRSPLLDINKLYEIIKNQDISAPRIKKEIPIGAHAEYRKAAKKEEELYTYILGIFELEYMSDKENEYLRYFTILPSVEIYIEDLFYFFEITEEKEISFENTLNSLVQKGWIQENDKTYKMHPLIQTVIREQLKPDAENCKDIIISFANLLSFKPEENPLSRKELIPFAENILYYIINNDPNLAILFEKTANIFRAMGNYNKTLEYIKKNLSITLYLYGVKHPDLADSYNNIAITYCLLGNFKKALEYLEKSIEIIENVSVPNHKNLATYYDNIAGTYRYLGNYEKAKEYQEKSFKIFVKVLDSNHPDLATSYGNMALTYSYLGNYDQAFEYQIKSISIKEKVLDHDHPSLAISYSNLAVIYKNLDNNIKALEYQEKSIAIQENILEPTHPSLAISFNNISEIYRSLGNYEKAMEFQNKAIEISEKILLSDHPNLVTSYINIGANYYDMKDYKQAKYYIDKAVKICKIALPEDHPDLKNSLEWQKIINDALNNQ